MCGYSDIFQVDKCHEADRFKAVDMLRFRYADPVWRHQRLKEEEIKGSLNA